MGKRLKEIFISLDLYLIGLVERFCHRFQIWTGYTNLFLARITNTILLVALAYELIDVSKVGINPNVVFGYFYTAFVAGILVWYYGFEEYNSIRRLSNATANPRKIDPFHRRLRIFGIVFYAFACFLAAMVWSPTFLSGSTPKGSSVTWYDEVQFISLIFWLYLIACDPLPPAAGKIQNWLMKFFGQPVRAESSN